MKNNAVSSNEQREDFRDIISEEISDMFACQQPECREIFIEDEIEEVGMYIFEL